MRNIYLLLVILCAACGSAPEEPVFTAPGSLEGGWTLSTAQEAVEGVPDEIRQRGPRYALRAVYDGPGSLTASFYLMPAEGSAFELVQKQRPEPGKLRFYKGPWFVVLESEGQETAALSSIAADIERRLPAE